LNKKISNKDKEDWENFLSGEENLLDKDEKSIKKIKIKINTFDLHGYSLEEANRKIDYLIQDAFDLGVGKLIIVTGKGLHSQNEKDPYVSKDLSILKYSVPEYVRGKESLMKMINAIEEADTKDGGSGAFYIFLKKKL
jgi:DNA-nicking Smr family endonuclease|tara:strand:+ start:769 stop:1182 length:414 start_codon:yes stop_codon:yes gene_type:complete